MGTTQEIVNTMSDFVNSFTCDYKGFANIMGMEHPTLQQNFTKLCVAWLKHLSNKEHYDLRNEASVKFAKSIKEELEKVGLPTI